MKRLQRRLDQPIGRDEEPTHSHLSLVMYANRHTPCSEAQRSTQSVVVMKSEHVISLRRLGFVVSLTQRQIEGPVEMMMMPLAQAQHIGDIIGSTSFIFPVQIIANLGNVMKCVHSCCSLWAGLRSLKGSVNVLVSLGVFAFC